MPIGSSGGVRGGMCALDGAVKPVVNTFPATTHTHVRLEQLGQAKVNYAHGA